MYAKSMRAAVFSLLVALVGWSVSEPADAHGRARVSVGFAFGYPYWGSPWWGPWGPGYWPGPYYYPYYPATTVVVPAQPMQYIEKGSAPAAESWWYYCEASKGYYPYVKECPSGWQRVPPTPPPAAR